MTALNRIPGFLIWIITVDTTSSAVNSTPSLQKMPLRSFAVICVKSALYSGLSAASEVLPNAVETAIRIDVPEGIERRLLQSVGLGWH